MPVRETRDLSELARTSGRKPDSYEFWRRRVIFGCCGKVQGWSQTQPDSGTQTTSPGGAWAFFKVPPLGLASFSNPARYPQLLFTVPGKNIFSKHFLRVPEFSLIGLAWITHRSLSHLGYPGNEKASYPDLGGVLGFRETCHGKKLIRCIWLCNF